MGQPIRWDNVGGANLSEASRPLEAAQRSFLGAFDTVGNALQQRQTIEDQNWQNTKSNNTNAYLDAVSRLSTPEQLVAAKAQGGALDQLRSQFGNQVDANAIRGAVDARTAAVQQQAMQDITYKNALADQNSHPYLDAYHAAAQKGDQAGMDAAAKAYQAAGGRDLGGLYDYATQTTRATQNFNLGQDKGKQEIAASKANILNAQAQTRIAAGNLAVNQGQLNEMRTQNQFSRDTELQNRDAARRAGMVSALYKGLDQQGNMYTEGEYNGKQSGELTQEMIKSGIGDSQGERGAIIDRANEMFRKGVDIKDSNGNKYTIRNIPLSAVRAAILGSKDQMLNSWNQGWANTFEKNLKDILSQTQVIDVPLSNGKMGKQEVSKPLNDLIQFRDALKASEQYAVPQYPTRLKLPQPGGHGK